MPKYILYYLKSEQLTPFMRNLCKVDSHSVLE